MSELRVVLRLEGDAMESDEWGEVVGILRELADYVELQQCVDYAHSRRLMDVNGNVVGEVRVER